MAHVFYGTKLGETVHATKAIKVTRRYYVSTAARRYKSYHVKEITLTNANGKKTENIYEVTRPQIIAAFVEIIRYKANSDGRWDSVSYEINNDDIRRAAEDLSQRKKEA